ncbi:hypothetical protein [Syntrophomonas curvata]
MINDDNILNFNDIKNILKDICSACPLEGSSECVKSKCLTGFSTIVVEFYRSKGKLNIPGAEGLIPRDDFKVYDRDLIASSIGETCKLCRQCRDNHSDDCVISLVRNSMETAFWGDAIPYPGNILQYLQMVREKDSELADYIMASYRRKSAAGA